MKSTFSIIHNLRTHSTYVKVHAAFVGAWQQSVFWLYPAFCTAQRVSYVQRKSRPHLNRLMGSNSQPDPAEGHVGRSCAGKVVTWDRTGAGTATRIRVKRMVRTDEFIVLVGRRPSDAAAAGALAIMVAEMHVDRSKARAECQSAPLKIR